MNFKLTNTAILFIISISFISTNEGKASQLIDRKSLVERNNPTVTQFDSLSSLSVGNGEFAFTTDITGLQTFQDYCKDGVPLGTQSQWGWHSFDNPNNYRFEETLKVYDFGHGRKELYSTQFNEPGRQQYAADWYRENSHRLHLGIIGFEWDKATPQDVSNAVQKLDMYNGVIKSNFIHNNTKYQVETVCHPKIDMISCSTICNGNEKPSIKLHFPYPTGKHCDDGCDWSKMNLHTTEIIESNSNSALLKRTIDLTTYYVLVQWESSASLDKKGNNYFVLKSNNNKLKFSCHFSSTKPSQHSLKFDVTKRDASKNWNNFWNNGGIVDFSRCKDSRAKELERRVVLSQYLLAIQCSGSTPPQETGLTYNSWFGKFHLEMIWWHQVQFALWGRAHLLERTLPWYDKVAPIAREIAQRQGFKGLRWMKMTDPSGKEAPSKVGSFLIWQQPHYIYMAELIYRNNPSQETLKKYSSLVNETAEFMADYVTYDSINKRYVIKGCIPAQETLKASETINPPFELSYWHFALQTAQQWLERVGLPRNAEWDNIIINLSPLSSNSDSLYLAAENAIDSYKDIRFTSDHMAVLGAYGILPECKLVDKKIMWNTLQWVFNNWNWDKTWGWDYPMTAMNAARLGEPERAVSALLMDKRTNTYLINGHNYQDNRLRIYLPGNGGLLTAVAMMCAGWDGCKENNPGFPKDGNWDVRWEGLKQMP